MGLGCKCQASARYSVRSYQRVGYQSNLNEVPIRYCGLWMHGIIFLFFYNYFVFYSESYVKTNSFFVYMGRNHHNLLVYKKAYAFTLECYAAADLLSDSQMQSQLRRALMSIPLNIAEGCGSRSQKVLRNHLSYAYGSAREVEVLLTLCKDLAYLADEVADELITLLDTIKKMLYGFLKRVEEDISSGKNVFSYS